MLIIYRVYSYDGFAVSFNKRINTSCSLQACVAAHVNDRTRLGLETNAICNSFKYSLAVPSDKSRCGGSRVLCSF